MRRRWQLTTLLGGLLFLGVAATMIVAMTAPARYDAEHSVSGESAHGIVREYHNRAFSLRFYYPNTWQQAEMETGVTIQPEAPSTAFMEQGALFAVWQTSSGSEANSLAPILQTITESTNTLHAAENVAVGGVSGTETVYGVEINTETSISSMDSRVVSALQTANSQRLTMILWVSNEVEHPYTVLMADARDGNYLQTLQQIRNSMQWE